MVWQWFCLPKRVATALLLLFSPAVSVLELTNGKSLGSLSPTPLGVKEGYKM